jgi:hypothetical protein
MCFNDRVSILTYIIGMIGCINLYFNLDLKVEAIFFAWVIQMQLIEYFLWTNQSCNQENINVTKTGIIINHLEPIVLWVAILVLSKYNLPTYVNILMTIFLLATYLYTTTVFTDECTMKEGKHLVWKWNMGEYANYYYIFFLICMNLLLINGVDNGTKLAIMSTISYAISIMIYGSEKSIGAMWCFFAAFVPWIIPYIK